MEKKIDLEEGLVLEDFTNNWESEILTSEEIEKLSDELLASCGLGCGGHLPY